jgi:hypothetical protein
MRPDLLEAQASVDWPFSQLPDLAKRINAWLDRSVRVEIRETPPPATENAIVAVEKEWLPLSFNVEVGAYINAVRSSLDILAMALVRRHNIEIREDRVLFPIASSESAFQNRKLAGRQPLEALPPQDRDTIEALKPYQGGNEALWALHHLDIVRKHRHLLSVSLRPIHISLQGSLAPGDFTPLATGTIQVNDEVVLGLLRKGVDPTLVRSKFYVGLTEGGYVGHTRRAAPASRTATLS